MEYAHIDRITRLGVSFFFITFIFAAVESKPTTGSDDATESFGGFDSKLGPSQNNVDASTTEVLPDASHRNIMQLNAVPTSKWRTDVFSNISDQQPALEGNSSGLNKFTIPSHPTGNLSKSENAGNIPDKNESSSRLTDKIIDEVDSKHGDLVRYTDAKNHKDSTYLSGTKEDRKVDGRELETLAASNVKVVINSSGSDVIKSNATSEKETTLSDSADRKHDELSNDTEAKSNKNVSYLSDSRVTQEDNKVDGREFETMASSDIKVLINSSGSDVIKSNATSRKETTLSDSAASKQHEISNDTDANNHKKMSYLSDSRVTKKDKKVDGREVDTLASSNVKVVINSSSSDVIKSNVTSEKETTLSDSAASKHDELSNDTDVNRHKNSSYISDSRVMKKDKKVDGREVDTLASSNVKVVINSSSSDVIKSNATSEKKTTLSDSAARKHELSNDTDANRHKNSSYISDSRVTKKDKKMDGRELDTLASSYVKVVINSSSSDVIKSNATSEKETTLSDSAVSKHDELSNDTGANRHKNSSYLSDSRVIKKDKKVDGRELEILASSNAKVVINSSGSNVIKSNATSEEEITISDSNIVKEDRNVNISDLNTKCLIDSTGSDTIKVKVLPGHEANIPAASQRVNTIATDNESATDGVNHNCSKHMNKMIALGSATLMTTIKANAKVDSQSTVANESPGKQISSVKQPNGHYNCCNHVEEVMAAGSTTVMTAVRASEVSGANLTQHNNTIVVSQNAVANGNSGIEISRVQPHTGHTCCQQIENIMESGYTTVMTVIRINGSNLAQQANAIREVDSQNTVANATEGGNGNEHFKLNHAHENCSEMHPSASASVMAEINNNITSVTEKYSDIDLVASATSGSENSAQNGSPGNISPVSTQSKDIVPSSFFIEVSMIASTGTKSTLKINNTVYSSSEQDLLIVNKASLELVGNKATNNSLTNEIVQLESQNILVKTLVTLQEDDDDANKNKRGTKIGKKNAMQNTSSAIVNAYHNRSEDDGKAVNDSFDSVYNKTSSDSNLSASNVFNNSDNYDDCSQKFSENTNLTVSSDAVKIISVLNSSINVNIGTMSQNEIHPAASESAIAVIAIGNGDRVSGTNRVLETDQTNEKPSETKMYFSAIKITTPKHVTGTSTNIINSTVTYPKSELEKSNTTLKEGPPILFNDRPQQNSQENADTLSMYTQSTIYTTPLGKENRSNITIDNFQEDANTNKYTTASDEYKSELTSNVSTIIISSHNNINKVLSQLGVADSFSNATLVQPASNITHKSNGTEKEFEMASSNVDKVLIEVYSEVNSKVDSPGTANTSVDTRNTYSATLGSNATQSSPSDGQNKSASTDQNQLQEFGALNDSIADDSVKSTWRNNIEIIPDITIVHSSSELYEKPELEAGSRTTSKHSDVPRNEKISASDHLPQAVTHTLPFNKTGSRVIPQGVNRELKKIVHLYVNNVKLKMSASPLKNNSISSFRNHSEQSPQYSGTNSQKRLLNSSKKLSSNLTDVLAETKVADFSPTGEGSSNIRVQLQNTSTDETPKNSIVGKLNIINKTNRSMGNATKQTFSTIERKSEPTVLTADAPMLMVVTNTTEGRAKRKKRNVDFFPINSIEQRQNTLLIPAEPERPEAAFKVATKNIPKAEEGMSIVYMLERSLSNDTSDETDKSSSSNYYYTVTLPAFFGILIGVIVCCVVLRAGGWCCRLFKNDSHSVLVEEVLAEHERERRYTQSGDHRPSRRQSLM